ncbi:endonuclease, partial [bacterium]|nr:endonuclease [bacterium]
KDTLLDLDNSVLATFKSAKDSTKFDMDAFKEAMPEVYERFLKPVQGSRRFLLK